jgi:hypothetical protein
MDNNLKIEQVKKPYRKQDTQFMIGKHQAQLQNLA